MKSVLWLMLLTFALSGCATFEKLLGKKEDKKPVMTEIAQAPRYSENTQMSVPTDRSYKRWTRDRMEEESELGANAGSTWIMEGQGAYLFSQNKMRREGDVLNIRLDDPAMKQVETKVSVIKKLLKQLEEQEKANSLPNRGLASEKPADPKVETKTAATEKKDEKEEPIKLDEVQTVPSKIVEKLADGNYRLKGSQPFMIGKREYKVIVTGMIRPEDYNDEGISSQKLLDPQYDVVSIRRGKQ
ncbi:MAG: flagellar basal body L-ring protein FlgH [Bdellovibrionia bacterium]